MINQKKILKNTDPEIFFKPMKEHLNHNINEKSQRSISNLLAIDYEHRLKSEPEIYEYSDLCTNRLKDFLGEKVILDDSFPTLMKLFTVAITPQKDIENEDDLKNRTKNNTIDAIIENNFAELKPEEKKVLRSILKDLLSGEKEKDVSNFISSNPKLFYSILISALKSKQKQKEVVEEVNMHINTILKKLNRLNKSKNKIKSISTKVTMAGGLFATASMGLLFGGFALPALIIPAAIGAIKYGPMIGDKIGGKISDNIKSIKGLEQELDNIINVEKSSPAQSVKTPEKKVVKSKSIKEDLKQEINNTVGKDIKKNILTNTKDIKTQNKATEKIKKKDLNKRQIEDEAIKIMNNVKGR